MVNPYTYTIPGDLAAVDSTNLHAEILASSISSQALTDVQKPTTTSLKVTFAADLSAADKTTLDGGLTQAEEHPPLAGSLLADHRSLANNKSTKITQMGEDVTTYIYSKYDTETQSSFGLMYTRAINGGLMPNRAAYIAAAIDWWEDSVMAHFYTKKNDMLAAADQAALDAITWDFTQFSAGATDGDPEANIEGAIAITD